MARHSAEASDPAGPSAAGRSPAGPRPSWTFLTNHGHVLLAIATTPDRTVAELADRVGITPRTTLSILKDLEQAGYLERTRVGRRTQYRIDRHRHFRSQLAAGHEVGELLAIFAPEEQPDERGGDATASRGAR